VSFVAGVVDPAEGLAHPDCRRAHVHVGPAVHRHSAGSLRQLDAADPLRTKKRLREVRVPSKHGAQNESPVRLQRYR